MKTTPAERASMADYYQKNKDKILPRQRAYRAAHREEIRAREAAYYQDHGEEILASQAVYRVDHGDAIREKNAKEFAEFTEWLQILRTNNGCEDCETHKGRLLHHHVDPSTKRCDLSQMYTFSLDALEEELEKCVVSCWPCHQKRHALLAVLP